MNIPTSKPLVENAFLENLMCDKLILDLGFKKFSGYSYLVINTDLGFQEGILLFSKGDVVGSIYFNSFNGIEVYGKDAFDLSISSFGYTDGILNIYRLTDEQIKLILIFNDKIKFDFKINKINVSKLKFKYDESYLKSFLKEAQFNKIDLRADIINKLNLSELLRE
ncbi:MAG: hypothetical protein WCY27_03825 [archaeon]|jgi:hypothetical protein|nr:hypothetical protein [archaeon]MDD2477545.1 hypothetical protein [Candidatus ainarchaeum sp.]MDD3084359.1 hypothetical protein [Candidatus ainarchaeum sp.]MDD4221462.1 hypothetical protein [Candidatus ainarchaeum sp.]MDD4662572.1 hypothetical protein [Candidatus ainarchaeum sp.]